MVLPGYLTSYFEKAYSWERDRLREAERSRRIAWTIAAIAGEGGGNVQGAQTNCRAKADDVRRLSAEGRTTTEIARALGIGRGSVYRALKLVEGASPLACHGQSPSRRPSGFPRDSRWPRA